MDNRIPTSAPDPSYLEPVAAPTPPGAPAVSEGQRIAGVHPTPVRTHAPRKGDRDTTALQPSLDLDMLQRLISPAAYRNVTRDGVSFLAAMRMLQAFLEDNKAAGPRASQEGVAPGPQADPPDGVPPMEAAARLVSEICKHGDTLDIYIHCAPKLG